MVRPERLELPTLCSEGRCSIQLSYGRWGIFYGKSEAEQPARAGLLARDRSPSRRLIISTLNYQHTYSAAFFGGSMPRYFITSCKSFQASPFWRGSRRRNAGW